MQASYRRSGERRFTWRRGRRSRARGSVEFFHTCPGLYVPRPLLIRPARASIDLIGALREVLALSKMHWNNAQLDERDPLTVRTAGRVGAILKHVPLGQAVANRYAYSM